MADQFEKDSNEYIESLIEFAKKDASGNVWALIDLVCEIRLAEISGNTVGENYIPMLEDVLQAGAVLNVDAIRFSAAVSS